jgi:hypothetical protein
MLYQQALWNAGNAEHLREIMARLDSCPRGSSPWPVLNKAEAEGENVIIPTWPDLSEFINNMLEGGFRGHREFIDTSRRFFNRRLSSATPLRRLFISSKKYVGLIPISAQIGDVISFMTFFLRKIDNSHYRLVGETYVHGLMYGELFQDQSKEPEQIVLE